MRQLAGNWPGTLAVACAAILLAACEGIFTGTAAESLPLEPEAGGGFKPGFAYGATDEFGHLATDGKVHMHDLHATILHQLGLDQELLTFPHLGRDERLTLTNGKLISEAL